MKKLYDLSQYRETKICAPNKETLDKITEELNNIDNIFDYIENVYIIFQSNTKEEIIKNIHDKKLDKINLNNNDNNQKIKYIFNILKFYETNNNSDQVNHL